MKDIMNKASSFLPIILMVVVFYFMIIRPQNKKRKETEEMLNNLKIGDEIVTHSGMLGKISVINDTRVSIEIADKVSIQILKSSVMKKMT